MGLTKSEIIIEFPTSAGRTISFSPVGQKAKLSNTLPEAFSIRTPEPELGTRNATRGEVLRPGHTTVRRWFRGEPVCAKHNPQPKPINRPFAFLAARHKDSIAHNFPALRKPGLFEDSRSESERASETNPGKSLGNEMQQKPTTSCPPQKLTRIARIGLQSGRRGVEWRDEILIKFYQKRIYSIRASRPAASADTRVKG